MKDAVKKQTYSHQKNLFFSMVMFSIFRSRVDDSGEAIAPLSDEDQHPDHSLLTQLDSSEQSPFDYKVERLMSALQQLVDSAH